MDIKKVKSKLEKNKLINKILYLKEVNSTQIFAKNNRKDIESGTIILTENQTAGIGTHGRVWESENGKNLTFTIVLNQNKKINELEYITLQLAECIIKVIKQIYNTNADIKIPNDIIINNKKVAGILTETKIEGECVTELYIGIGLNINQKLFTKELENIATSLLNETNKYVGKEEIFIKLISEIEKII